MPGMQSRRRGIISKKHGASNASGIPIPNVVSGFTRILANDFDTPFALGAVSSADPGHPVSLPAPYDVDFGTAPDFWGDTSQTAFGAPSCYRPSQVLSCSGSCLRKHLWVNTTEFAPQNVPQSASVYVGAAQLYGRFSVCFRRPATFNGWKLAWLHWPVSNVWPRDGEIDFPEGTLNSNIEAYMHWQGGTSGGDQDGYSPGTAYGSGWHVATLEWLPTRCTFILDGVTIGNSTTTAHIPNTSMYWNLQTETEFSGYPANYPVPTDVGDIEIDWVAMWSFP